LEKSGIQKADELVHLKEQIGSLQLSLEGENRRFIFAKTERDRLQKELELAHKSLLEKDDAIKHIEGLLNDTLTRDQIRKEDKGILEKMMLDRDNYFAQIENIRTSIDRIERDLKIVNMENISLPARVYKIVEFTSTFKANTISLANFSVGNQVLMQPNEAGFYEILQKPKATPKYFLDPQLIHETSIFYKEIKKELL